MENVIIVNFNVESEAYQAFSVLKQDPINTSCKVSQIILVKDQNGTMNIPEQFDTGISTGDDFAKGSLIGLCVGILGGPVGMLLGWGVGAMTGSLIDAGDATENASLLEQVMKNLQDGQVALVALVQETDTMMFDSKMQPFDTTITRYDAAAISEEAEQARKLQKEMAKQTREKMRAEKSEERKAKIREKSEELKERFSHLTTHS